MTRLVLISQSEAARTGLREALGPDVDIVATWPADEDEPTTIVKQATLHPPEVVVLGPDLSLDRAVAIAAAFDDDRPEIEVLLIARPSPQLWEKALRAGVRDVLTPNQAGEAVRATIERAIETSQRRRANLSGERESDGGARVIVVLSPKGGAGKTTVACNLAVGIAAVKAREVVLFDTDLQFGDVANALRLTPDVSFGDAVSAGLTDLTSLKLALTPHPTGVYALCAPELPADSDDINGDHVARAVSLLREEFRYIVVDTDAGLGERTLAAIEGATDLIFVCATDVPSVRALRKELDALDTIGMTHQRRHIVLNRADAKVGLTADDIQSTVSHRIDVFVPSSRSVPVAMNQGIPLLENNAPSPATKALRELVARFVDTAPPPTMTAAGARRGGLRRKKEV
jgi:pilus assembly protein CpaE